MKFCLTKNTTNTLKIISALMVVIHHYSQYVCANRLSDSIFYKVMSAQAGFLGVAVFFFLSGYGLMESEQKSHLNLKQFFKRRLLKIYLPVIVVTILWTVIAPYLLSKSPFTGLSINIGSDREIIIGNIFWNFGDGVLWFVRVLICLYVMFYIFSLLYIHKSQWALIFLGFSTIGLTVLVANIWIPHEAISVPFFSLGIILSLLRNHKYGFSITLVLLLAYLAFGFLMYDFTLAMHCGLNVILLSLIIILLFTNHIDFKVPAFVGIISFDLYLVHHKVLMAMEGLVAVPSLWLYLAIVLLITLIFYIFRTKLLKI